MAFIDRDIENPEDAPFYNVNFAVGKNCPNYREDVLLVQFFLKRIYMIDGMTGLKPKGNMTVDGKCGPVTQNWIRKFQIDMMNRGLKCYPDGLVNKAGNTTGNKVGSLSHTFYTIRLMNNGMRTGDRQLYKSLAVNPEVPDELRAMFAQMQSQSAAII
jgi:hypothetical protein